VTKGNSHYNVAGDVEEYRTVGIGNSTKENAKNIGVYGDYNKADDITENGEMNHVTQDGHIYGNDGE